MAHTVAELLVDTLARIGVRQIFGIVGDALNPFTDALRRDGRIEWIGVRHEEGAALAAAADPSKSAAVDSSSRPRALEPSRYNESASWRASTSSS